MEAVQALGVTEADLPPLPNGIRRDEDQPGAGAEGLGAADLTPSNDYKQSGNDSGQVARRSDNQL